MPALKRLARRAADSAAGVRRWFLALYRRSKPLALVVLFLVTASVMWGTTALFRAVTHRFAGDKKDAGAAGPMGPVPVNVIQLKPTSFQDTLNAVGTILGGAEIPLRFEVEGRIESFPMQEGEKVSRGQVIAQLRQREASLKLKRTLAELKDAETLYALGAIKKSHLEQSRLLVEMAQSELEKTVLRASRDGILGNKNAEAGQFVTPAQKIASLVSIESVIVQVGIIEREIDKVFPGQRVIVTVDPYPNQEFTGKVDAISPIVEGRAKTLTVQARLANEGGLLLPGMFARTKIIVFEQDEALVVPQDSLTKTSADAGGGTGGGYQVFVVRPAETPGGTTGEKPPGERGGHSETGKEQKVEARPVEVGHLSAEFAQIAKGLSPGELVVVERPHGLKDGDRVKILEVQK